MNKQIIIAGLLGAIEAAEDPTPCENVMTDGAATMLADLEAKLLDLQGGTADAEEAAEAEALLYSNAVDAHAAALAVVNPFYLAMNEAALDYSNASSTLSTAEGLVTTLEDASSATTIGITGDTMHSLSVEAFTDAQAAASDDIDDAQDAYTALFNEINDDTYTDSASATQVGFRKALANAVSNLALEEDAEDLADDAESAAQSAFDAQEETVLGLLYIEGCESIDTTTYTTEATELEEYVLCCTPLLTSYMGVEFAADGTFTEYECVQAETSVGFGMEQQFKTYDTAQATDASTFTSYCTNSTTTDYLDYNCDTDNAGATDTVYTDWKAAKLAYEKTARTMDLVNAACWDGETYVIGTALGTSTTPGTYDCSNGALSNGNDTCTTFGSCDAYVAADKFDTAKLFHMMKGNADTNGTTFSVADANFDIVAFLRAGAYATNADAIASATTNDWDIKYQGLADALKDWTLSEARYYAYKAALTSHKALITTGSSTEDDLKDTLDQKVDLSQAADLMVTAATKDQSRTTTNLGDQIMELGLLQDALTLAHEAHAVQTYLLGQANTATASQQMIVDAWSEQCADAADDDTCYNALTQLQGLSDTAASNYDSVAASMDMTYNAGTGVWDGFYTTAVTETGMMSEMVGGLYSENLQYIGMLEGYVAAAEAAHLAAIATCKGLGYDEAQAAKKALIDLEDANETAAAEVAIDYAAKAAFATTGGANTLCAYPTTKEDSERPECSEDYCCGAAQKFLRDGTKLTIETCQKAEGVNTYDFYPPLPEGAPVEPEPETWRFSCISGAQKLAATTAAALAASYMMA